MPDFTLDTPHGLISITDTGLKNDAPTLLLLHGNSSSSKIFRHMLESPTITNQYRVIAFDYPSHGASSNALNPAHDYTQRGYAELAVHILKHLRIASVVAMGWSLGGHVALEMVPLLKQGRAESEESEVKLKGLVLTGTPPASGWEQCRKGFRIPLGDKEKGEENLMAKVHWTEEQAEQIVRMSAAGGKEELFEDWMVTDALRVDGRARMVMFNAMMNGDGCDQVGIVETEDVPVAVINGADEPFIDLDYIDGLRWKSLWRGHSVRMSRLKHTPFWEDPKGYEGVLVEFLQDCGCDDSKAFEQRKDSKGNGSEI
jgi:pimeloyl-ACP methyl ester carboxylesterase